MPRGQPDKYQPPAREEEAVDRLLAELAKREAARAAADDAAFLRRFAASAGRMEGARRPRRARRKLPSRRPALAPLAVAAALLLLATAAFLIATSRKEPRFLLRTSDVRLAVEAGGTVIHSGTAGEFVCDLDGGRITIYGRDRVELLLAGEDRVRLTNGELWFHVEPRSGAFTVDTRHGTVSVLGTVFGVRTEPDGATVHVAQGLISAGDEASAWTVRAGEAFRLEEGGHRFDPEDSLSVPPAWVWDLHRRATGIDWQSIYPSRSPHE